MIKEEIIRLVKKTDLLGIIDSQYYDNELWIFDVMEFAKLIARECAQVCRNQSNIYALKADRDNCAIAIEEHFGVEE
jgi:hypothetical protein